MGVNEAAALLKTVIVTSLSSTMRSPTDHASGPYRGIIRLRTRSPKPFGI